MRITLVILVVLLGFMNTSIAAEDDEIKLSEPPFWMMSYEEYGDLQQIQKDFYNEKMTAALKKVPSLKKFSGDDMKDATEWYKSWEGVMKKLYRDCKDKSLEKTCEEIADIRLQTFDMLANQKEENRVADEESKTVKPLKADTPPKKSAKSNKSEKAEKTDKATK